MSSLVKATSVWSDANSLWLDLWDGRRSRVPLAWFPKLLNAMPAVRDHVTISRRGLHWVDLDEDISVEGLLAGRSDLTRPKPKIGAARP